MRAIPFLLASIVWLTVVPRSPAQSPAAKGIEFFESKIRPVLVEHCYRCHSEAAKKKGKLKAGLLLDSKAGLLKGGESGPVLVVGKPKESLLLKALRHDGDLQMPPTGKLSAAVLNDFEMWIKFGAPDPRDGKQQQVAESTIDWNKARQFWAFQLPRKSPVPRMKDAAWPKRDIDHFILAELEKRNLKPVGPAGKRDLLRRATFDLIGLPPTPEEIDAFLKDNSPDAFAKVVDRLLASPHYGERWARYWLDVARYAEDKALAFVNVRPHAYRYRDWVVQALNNDMPYDRFLRLQLAGDLVGDTESDYFVKLAGLGFQGLGQEYHRGSVTAQVIADELDDRIDTLSRGLLGLTVSCARCHDHKYDPIPARDYYSLAAAYNGSNLTVAPLADPKTVEKHKAWEKQTKELEAKLKHWVKEQARNMARTELANVGKYLQTAWQIRVLRQHKLAADVGSIARREKLQPLFLKRAVQALEQKALDQQEPALKSWLTVMEQVSRSVTPEKDRVPVPAVLSKASEDLNRRMQATLNQKSKDTPQLMQILLIKPTAIFLVNDREAPLVLTEADRNELATRNADLERRRKTSPPAPALAHVVSGGGTAMRVYIRGNVERAGEPAPPGFLRILAQDGKGSGKFTRLDLADAIASAKNPLTARVIVNRVWHYHFGRGIVGTTSNFGRLGDRPTHPELLDTLAVRFMEAGWSLRWLHREIMLSTAYQLAGTSEPGNAERDPENQYLWRYTPRRLDFEAWRDAWLAVSGRLDFARGGPSIDLYDTKNVRRTLYAKVSRLEPNKLMVLFDFPDANVTSDRRSVTTVPQQQLFVLNSDFTIETAKAFARRLEKAASKEEDRIALAFRLAFGREPAGEEMRASQEFIRGAGARDRLTPWEQFAQSLLASNEFMWID